MQNIDNQIATHELERRGALKDFLEYPDAVSEGADAEIFNRYVV